MTAKKIVMTVCAVFVLLLTVPLEAQTRRQDLSGKKVIVADANSTHHLNLYVAFEKGLFKKRGLEVEIQQTNSGVAAVVGGEADIVFNCPTGVITPIAR
ncbi:MAG: ABC transporter substrate-binding protein, partial [Treponema sp.]|nr:ABC transporter substrate-binding protein [Treponema sp.]